VDAGAGVHRDRAVVSYALHAARHLLPAAPDRVHSAGSRAPGRWTRQGRDRHLAGCDLGEASRLAAATEAYLCFEDEAGQSLRPPKARTWARRGRTPVVLVSGKGSGQVSAAGLACYLPGARSPFFYRAHIHTGRKGERRSLSEAGYADLKNRLKRIQYRPALIDEFLAQTGLSLEPEPP
jgi:hypothetical protein